MSDSLQNALYFGDCLEVMREEIADESINLIYLDPPFNSKRLYNAFMEGAQWVAFDDTWHWSEAINDFHETAGDVRMADTMEGLKRILGEGPNLAYLSYMANRLRECQRILKREGSIYLHCDPTMSHYLKLVMDAVFGRGRFANEIVWQRQRGAKGDAMQYGRNSDRILYYTNSEDYTFAPPRAEKHNEKTIKDWYNKSDEHGRYVSRPLTAEGTSGGDSGMPWRGRQPTGHWTVPRLLQKRFESRYGKKLVGTVRQRLDILADAGLIDFSATGNPSWRRYLHEATLPRIHDIWDDDGVRPISRTSQERLGYPTQKPLSLLKRIIEASSKPGDVVFDPFCGCGTTVHAAQALGRHWIGIDVCVNACKVIEKRLRGHFDSLWDDVKFIGMPKTCDDAEELARIDKFRFERWAASLVDGMEANTRQRGDRGIDGRGRLPIRKGEFVDIVSQVKGGKTGPGDIQAFNGARQQAGADLGVFTCFEARVTQAMRDAAASAGRFMNAPRIQIYTIEDFFEGRRPLMPLPV